ncbi:MAG: GNAT family N-acetyltransferase [Mogibacterium sp.]|nr:GNAT family N-acetyltransferase [Mogibacterium sp.]
MTIIVLNTAGSRPWRSLRARWIIRKASGKLVGSGYSFTDSENGLTCIDGIIVDEDYRRQYIATSLIAHIKDTCSGTQLFINTDDEDTPKEMYLKMGFEAVDRLYEYTGTDIDSAICYYYGRNEQK